MSEQTEVYGLLIPLRRERLLVPRMCVAEVIPTADADFEREADAPDWYLGSVDWNGRRVPVVSFDRGEAEDSQTLTKASRARIVVFHAITKKLKPGYYGVLTQSFPQLVRVNEDGLALDADNVMPRNPLLLCRVRMNQEFPLIPDIERLESMLATL